MHHKNVDCIYGAKCRNDACPFKHHHKEPTTVSSEIFVPKTKDSPFDIIIGYNIYRYRYEPARGTYCFDSVTTTDHYFDDQYDIKENGEAEIQPMVWPDDDDDDDEESVISNMTDDELHNYYKNKYVKY